ncbi:MAG TPA: S9 family peptidase [Kofleriaceae bacterium]|jgi:dipeptidyl aminopeptidase/acylaminoacyl peptidase
MKAIALVATLAACGGSAAKRPTPGDVREPGVAPAGTPPPSPAPAPPSAEPVAVGHPRNDLIPRSVLFGNPERAALRISPDGRWLAWLAPVDGVLQIWVAPFAHPETPSPVTNAARPIHSFQWTYATNTLLFAQDTAGEENDHIFRVVVNAKGVEKRDDLTPQAGARAQIVKLSPLVPNVVVVAENDRDAQLMDLYALDLVSGQRFLRLKNSGGWGDYVVDWHLNPRFAEAKHPDGSMEIDEISSKGVSTMWDSVPFEDADTTAILELSPDGRTLYEYDARGRDTSAIVAVDIATKKSRVIAANDKADMDDALFQPRTNALQAAGYTYQRKAWTTVDPAIAPDLAALGKQLDGDPVITSRTLDDHWWTVASLSDGHGPRYYVYDRAKKTAQLLFMAQPSLEGVSLAHMTPEVIKARDGLELVAYVSMPSGARTPLPMVLLVHGGPWYRDRWGFDPVHQLLANRGYAVLSVEFRGSTGFGKKFLNASNLQWGKAMHDDLLDAVQWAVNKGITTPGHIAIMGGSYGGYATLAGLTLTPDVFACGVDLFGPSNLITLLASIPPYWKPMVSLFTQRMGDPNTAEGKAILVQASPLTHVAAIKKPLLIGQGANDARVKQAESEQIVAAMKQRGLPVTYTLFPDEGHGFSRPENNIAFFGVAEAFLSAHLGGNYQPLTPAELEASSMQIKDGRAGVPGLPPPSP